VRNSGAVAVAEGCGANGCEYMTGGTAVLLGKVGQNFAAGMTGGMAFVLDLPDENGDGDFQRQVNPDSVIVSRVASPHWEGVLRALITEHEQETGSRVAEGVLRDWDLLRRRFWQVCPKEMVGRLTHPLNAPNPAEATG
jgi:glutamate synthase (NADPH/NADH) large chain